MLIKIILIMITTAISFILSKFTIAYTNNHLSYKRKEQDVFYRCEQNNELTTALQFAKKLYKNEILFAGICSSVWAIVSILIYDRCLSLIGFIQIYFVLTAFMASAIVDFRYKLIPNFIPLSLFAVGTVLHGTALLLAFFNNELKSTGTTIGLFYVLSAFIVLLLMLICSAITKGGMGGGDVKLLAAVCYTGGLSLLLSVLMSSLLAGLLAGVLFLLLKIKKLKDEIPFAPFMYIGCVGSVILGLV